MSRPSRPARLPWHPLLVVLGVVSATGCRDEHDRWPQAHSGELGFANFYDCDPYDLLECSAALPRDLALGASLGVTFSVASHVPYEVQGRSIVSASHHILEPDGAAFRAVDVGTVALLALSDAQEVIDLLRFRVHPVTRIGVTSRPCAQDCSPPADEQVVYFPPTEAVNIAATPWNGDTPLGGTLEYTWTSLTPEVLAVTSRRGDEATLLVHGSLGRVRVTHGAITEDVTIVVGLGPLRNPLPELDESDSGTASTTDTDAGTSTSSAATDTDDTSTASGTDTAGDPETGETTSLVLTDGSETGSDVDLSGSSSGATEVERSERPARGAP